MGDSSSSASCAKADMGRASSRAVARAVASLTGFIRSLLIDGRTGRRPWSG